MFKGKTERNLRRNDPRIGEKIRILHCHGSHVRKESQERLDQQCQLSVKDDQLSSKMNIMG